MGATSRSHPEVSSISNATALFRDLKIAIEYIPLSHIKPYQRQLRRHSAAQVQSICDSITTLGFVDPIQIAKDGIIVAGEARYLAAQKLGLIDVPVIRLDHLSQAEQKALRIALNRIGEKSVWNNEALSIEFGELVIEDQNFELAFDLDITGFEADQIDTFVKSSSAHNPIDNSSNALAPNFPTTMSGDIWIAGDHRLICGDVGQSETLQLLLGDQLADVIVAGATGDQIERQLPQAQTDLGHGYQKSASLAQNMSLAARFGKQSAYQFWFAQWPEMQDLLEAGSNAELLLADLCVWKKPSGAAKGLYQPGHEMVFVFAGKEQKNTKTGRLKGPAADRQNLWDHSVANELLGAKPQLKTQTISMMATLMRDTTKRLGVVLDISSYSAASLIAADQCARRVRVATADPHEADRAILSWQQSSHSAATLQSTGETFQQTNARRRAATTEPPQLSKPQPTINIRGRGLR